MDGQVSAAMDYETWLRSKPEAFQREVLGPGRYDLWKNGVVGANGRSPVSLADMVDQKGRPVRVRELAGG